MSYANVLIPILTTGTPFQKAPELTPISTSPLVRLCSPIEEYCVLNSFLFQLL